MTKIAVFNLCNDVTFNKKSTLIYEGNYPTTVF